MVSMSITFPSSPNPLKDSDRFIVQLALCWLLLEGVQLPPVVTNRLGAIHHTPLYGERVRTYFSLRSWGSGRSRNGVPTDRADAPPLEGAVYGVQLWSVEATPNRASSGLPYSLSHAVSCLQTPPLPQNSELSKAFSFRERKKTLLGGPCCTQANGRAPTWEHASRFSGARRVFS